MRDYARARVRQAYENERRILHLRGIRKMRAVCALARRIVIVDYIVNRLQAACLL